jgi:peroxiredoxin
LQAYQALLPELQASGASLVAISPMLPDSSLSMAEKHALQFEVLSDVGNAVAREYGLVWRFPADLREVYETALKILLPRFDGDDSWELPIPATYVVDRGGTVRFAFVDPDYTRRAEPADILTAVQPPRRVRR